MDIEFTPQVLPFLGAALVLTGLLHVAWNNRRDPVARWFAATLIALLIWAVGYSLEIVSVTLGEKIFFANLQFVGVGFVSVCWWEMIRRYLSIRRLPRAVTVAMWLIPAATVIIAFVNPAGLFRGAPFIATGRAPFPALHADYGLWYRWVFVPEVTLLNGAVLMLLGRAIRTSHRFYRRQYVLLFLSLMLPLVGTIVYVLGLSPWSDYNLTVAIAGFSGLLLAVGLFRWRLFDIVPLARDLVVENLADGVIVVDAGGRIVDLNRSFELITRLERKPALGQPAGQQLAAFPALAEILGAADNGQVALAGRREMVIKRLGISHFYSISASPIAARHGDYLGRALVLHDVTERVRLFEQTRELANKDDLTGLANRRRFFELTSKELERARRYGTPVSFVLLDIDHFKLVNDTFGHRAGDLVLRELAAVCRRTLRATDVMGRFGGEEFAVLLPETKLKEAVEVAGRLKEAVESMQAGMGAYGSGISVTVSAGVTDFGDRPGSGPDTLDKLVERADKALYRAKDLGRNTVVASEGPAPLRAVG